MSNAPFPPPSRPLPPPRAPRAETPHARSPHLPAAIPSRWQPPRLSAAGWLATIGAVLLMAASIIVVVGNWASIDPAIRFAGLVASLVAVYAAAETGRRRLPSTSRALATLAACLTAPVGVAAAATIHQPWPVCTLVGGVAALLATEVQLRRWHVPALEALTVVAFGLAAVGASALTAIPVTVIAAVGAAVALGLGATRRGVALAAAVGMSPLLTLLADIGVGTGTLPRIGADGDDLVWSALVSCTIAALVIGVVAHRHHNQPLALAAAATLCGGVLTSLVAGDAAAEVWWSIPAVLLIVAEAIGAERSGSVWRSLARRVAPVLGFGLGALALTLPYVSVLMSSWPFERPDARWSVPFLLTALALVATSFGTAVHAGAPSRPVAARTAAGAAGFAVLLSLGLPVVTASGVVALAWIASASWTPRNLWDAPTAVAASWVTFGALVDSDVSVDAAVLMTLGAGIAVMIGVLACRRNDDGIRLVAAALLIGAAVGSVSTDSFAGGAGGALVALAMLAVGVTVRPTQSVVPLVLACAVAYPAVLDHLDRWPSVALVMTLAAAFAGSTRDPRSLRAHVSVVLAVIAGALALAVRDTDPGTAAMAGSAVAIALSGIALVDRRGLAALAGGTAAALLAVYASSFASPVFMSITVGILGLQLAVSGAIRLGEIAALPGVVLAGAGVTSFWWTTGTNAWAIERIQPYGATGVDLAVAAIAIVLLGTGWAVRQRQPISSWLAFGPSLALVSTWLLASQLEPNSDWATFGALVVGVVAIAIGGRRRLGAPLIAGSIMVVGTLLVSAGPRLATAPTWAWIALGGTGLLLLAAFIERSDRPSDSDSGEQDPSPVRRFCEEFR